jgi:hypothetical protein
MIPQIRAFWVTIFLALLIPNAFAEVAPERQINEGGRLYSLQLPHDIEVYPNAPLQTHMFLVDYGSDGEVVNVELRSGNQVKGSKNAEKLAAVIKSWRVTPSKMNGVLLKRWGVYYTITIKHKLKSDGGSTIRVSDNGANTVFEAVIPSTVTRTLTEDELMIFHKATPEPKFKNGGVLPTLQE